MKSAFPVLLALCTLPAGAQTVPGDGIGGIGTAACEDIAGIDNLPMLAQATDWALGYLAGRQDGGQQRTSDATLSTADPADVAVSLATYCRSYPYGLVLDAARNYGTEVFAEGPAPDPALGPDLPSLRPPQRPYIWPPVIAVAAEDGMEAVGADGVSEDRLSTQSRPAGIVPGLRPLPRPERP
ncbi:MAG: hypothetical protein ACU0BS_10950 [Hasllibacter sp.]